MAYDLEEQETLDQMKAWWEKWGTYITTAVLVLSLSFAGWNGWKWYQRNETVKASAVYVQLQQAVFNKDKKNIASLSNGLIGSYGSTVYAPLGALAAADATLEAGNTDDAAAKLKWVIEKSGYPEYNTIARVRLAGVYLDAGKFEDALAVLASAKPTPEQKTVVLDRQGDAWFAKGDIKEARASWDSALKNAQPGDPITRVIEYKLSALPQS